MERTILKDKIILIVDDYSLNTELLSIFIANTGAIPLTASNGMECVELIKRQHVDMILMDGNMPVMNGIEATKAVRALPQGKNLAIIGFSGSDEEENAQDSVQAGMNLVVDKLSLNEAKLIEIADRFFDELKDSARQHGLLQLSTDEKIVESTDDGTCPAKPDTSANAGIFDAKSADNPSTMTNQAVIDYRKALREFENDNDLLVSLIVDFNRILHSQCTTMVQALNNSDFERIKRESHGIKGGAANIFALPLAQAAKSLETACKQRAEKESIAGLLDNFIRAVDSFDQFVDGIRLNKSRSYPYPPAMPF